MIKNLVDAIERILFIHDSVKKDAQSPNILFFTSVWLALQNLGGGVVYKSTWSVLVSPASSKAGYKSEKGIRLTNSANEHVKRPILDISRTSKIY